MNRSSQEKRKTNMNTKSATAAVAKAAKTKAPSAPAPKSSPPADAALSKLRVGDVYNDGKQEVVVWFLNESRACIAPLDSHFEVRYRDDGMPTFAAAKSLGNISPDSLVTVTQSLGRKGFAEVLELRKKQSTESTMKSKSTTTKKAPKAAKKEGTGTPGIRAGSLGTYQGFSVASVVRTLGKAGWKAPEVRAFLNDQKLEASDQTIKLNIYRGVHGKDGEPAPLKSLPAKPKVEVKAKAAPAKPAAKAKAAPAKKPAVAAVGAATKPAAKPAATVSKAAAQVKALKETKAAKSAAPAA